MEALSRGLDGPRPFEKASHRFVFFVSHYKHTYRIICLPFVFLPIQTFKIHPLLGVRFFWAMNCKCFNCCPSLYSRCWSSKRQRILTQLSSYYSCCGDVAVFGAEFCTKTPPLYHNTVGELPTPPPSPSHRRHRCRCYCCRCWWCLSACVNKKKNRLSVVFVVVIAHLAEPVCAPARWLLLALIC